MKYTWDETKRKKTLKDRGLDFAAAEEVFEGSTLTFRVPL